jgi:hypothetical protein
VREQAVARWRPSYAVASPQSAIEGCGRAAPKACLASRTSASSAFARATPLYSLLLVMFPIRLANPIAGSVMILPWWFCEGPPFSLYHPQTRNKVTYMASYKHKSGGSSNYPFIKILNRPRGQTHLPLGTSIMVNPTCWPALEAASTSSKALGN